MVQAQRHDAEPAAGDWTGQLPVALVTIAASVLLVGPRAAPFMLALLLLAAGIAGRSLPTLPPPAAWPAPLTAAAALGLYLLVNATWAVERAAGLGKAAFFVILAGAIGLAWRGLPNVPPKTLERMARALIVAFAVSLAYLLFEEASNHLVKRTLFSLLPALRPDPKHMALEGEIVSHIALYVSNRNMAMLNFAIWPVLLGALTLLPRARALGAAALLLVASALAMLQSQHETSVIALGAAVLVFAIAHRWPWLAMGLVAAGLTVACLLVVPIVSQAYKAGLYTQKSIPMSARHRIILWGYTAEQIAKRPLLGVGVDSTKPLDAAHKYVQPPDHGYPRRTGTHGHNIYLQTWYELGAVGAVLLLAFGLALLAAIWRLEPRVRPFALASFASAGTIAGFSWGMWQPWFMAAFAVSAFLMLLMAETARRSAN